jgi:hypothetical protein
MLKGEIVQIEGNNHLVLDKPDGLRGDRKMGFLTEEDHHAKN